MTGSNGYWYGLKKDKEIQIQHKELSDWAFDNGYEISIGWSNFFTYKGINLVRGPKMISAARRQGWNDLANKLEKFGFKDE